MPKSRYLLVYGLLSISVFLSGCKSETSASSIKSAAPQTGANFTPIHSAGGESITKDDEHEVHDVIVAYFNSIENKDYASAWEMLSSEMKKDFTEDDAVQKHFGVESLKLVSIQTYLRPQEPKENEKKPTIHFVVKLDILNDKDGAWDNGINERFIGVVKEQGVWKISAIATSP